jgi:large subunit ribosomal protein LP0
MSGVENKAARKNAYFTKLIKLLDEFPKIFIVGCDNVGSAQMAKIRHSLRGKAVVLMGKNSMIRKAIRGHIENNKKLEALLPLVRGNIGFVFAKEDLSEVKKAITSLRVAAPAKAGTIAPIDVTVPAGPTGMEPTQTSFLQALNIQSKITRGQVEIIADVALIKAGNKVGASEANLLAKLDIKPFSYGLVIKSVYDDGAIYNPSVLDMTDNDIVAKFQSGVKNVAALSLAIHYPTVASVPHSVINGYKRVISIGLGTAYSFPKLEEIKKLLANPGKAVQKPTEKVDNKPQVKAPPKKPEPEPEPEEGDGDMGLGLFD